MKVSKQELERKLRLTHSAAKRTMASSYSVHRFLIVGQEQ